MTFKTKFKTAIATGAVLLNAFAPMTYATTSLTISGNGSNSDSDVYVDSNNATVVNQSNSLKVNNNVDVKADTGNNSASDNTGGDVEVKTGDANTDVRIKTEGNVNQANVSSCDCDSDTDVVISGNGTHSDNKVDLDRNNTTFVTQGNEAYVYNRVNVDATTGRNDADDNTGGDVRVKTGDANTDVRLYTTANVNSATVGGGNGGGGDVSAYILGNGSHSDNDIYLDFNNAAVISQGNYADVHNRVRVDGDTGHNDADDNTGGEVSIDTGNTDAVVVADTMVNFNAADAGCGCVADVDAKIGGNGTDSDNKIDVDFGSRRHAQLTVDQWNDANVDNQLKDIDGDTGHNDADDNTGSVEGGDPSIETGNADALVSVKTEGNHNIFGDLELGFDELLGGTNVHFTFDLGDLLGWLVSNTN